MNSKELPAFLHGTFDWRLDGLQLHSAPPFDLLAPSLLQSDNPWLILASVLEHAKHGDHSGVPLLSRLFNDHKPPALARVAILLVGDLGRDQDLDMLAEVMGGDDASSRMYACEAASLAGCLWLVPAMLDAWHRAEGLHDHEVIGYAISDLLEHDDGEIAAEAKVFAPTKLLDRVKANPRFAAMTKNLGILADEQLRFPNLVQAAHAKLQEAHGAGRVTVWNGAPFDVRVFAQQFLDLVREAAPVSFYKYRHKLEANTGIDCRHFFRNGEPQFLTISAAIRDFLDSNEIKKYRQGKRYFFGHSIPA
ncbi:hypothetical protein [Pseudoduganella sp. HUAS MS19]